jgi:hypothetical protein
MKVKNKRAYNLESKSNPHSKHLCYIVSQGFHLTNAEEYNALIKDPEFKCQHCRRSAKSADNLCKPEKL